MKLAGLIVTVVLGAISTSLYAKESLIESIKAERNARGGVVVSGKTTLPPGTKLMIDFGPAGNKQLFGQSKMSVDTNGQFSSEAFTNHGQPHKAGSYRIHVLSYFNPMWQSKEVLAKVGEGGPNLPAAALKPDDPEFPKAARHLDESIIVKLGDLSAELAAIEAVKNARLNVKGKGESADSIKDVVAFHEKAYAKTNPTAFKALSWSAKESSPGVWVVSLDLLDGGVRKQAQWEYNAKTKAVNYLDPLSKLLSWLPAQ